MHERHPSDLGLRVRELREVADLSARDLDRLAQITPGHTSTLESRTKTATVEILARIAQVFGVSLDWLAAGGKRPSDATVRANVRRALDLAPPRKAS